MGLPPFERITWQCFGDDHKGRLSTSFGFLERLNAVFKSAGYAVTTRIATEEERQVRAKWDETVYKPRWDRIEEHVARGFEFRYRQREVLEMIAAHENGRISCPTGYGKSIFPRLIAILYPKAKIDIVTDRCPVLLQRLFPDLSMNLPSVGIVGCCKKIKGKRVMLYSADSLHHGRADADIVIVDEGHEAGADKFSTSLGRYDHARMFAFSASWNLRLDNKDMRCEAMFGPIRITLTFSECVEAGVIVPVEIVWTDVKMDFNPCADEIDTDKKRLGIWSNDYRNSLIARDARLYDDETQVLITVETLEHALYLKQKLPEFELVYSDRVLEPKDLRKFERAGLIDHTFRSMTTQRREWLTKNFSSGKIKKAIATTVWNVGVDFKHLEVLIRADAGGSPVNDTQIPGRPVRTNEKLQKRSSEITKMAAIVHDYRDQFDPGLAQKAKGREKSYAANEWRQHFLRAEREQTLRKLLAGEKLI